MVVRNTCVTIQDCCKANNGRLRGRCHTCNGHLHDLQNICIMSCSSFGVEESLEIGFHENCGVCIGSGEIES